MASDPRWFLKKRTAFHIWRARILPTKTLSRGQFEHDAWTLRGETTCPSANIPATQHQRDGSEISFNRKGPRASSKNDTLTFLIRTCSRGYDDMLLLDHT